MSKLFCPFCSSQLDSEGSYYFCLKCGAEVFPGDQTADPYAGWQECYLEDIHRKGRRPGGSSGSKKRKAKVTRPLTSDRWQLE